MEAPEQEGSGHRKTMCRFQCPLACGERHKCPRDVAETVKVVREEECPQQDIFDEKEKYRDGETNFNT